MAMKKALVTGSRRGIGRAIALELARAGCDVGLNDIEKDSTSMALDLAGTGIRCNAIAPGYIDSQPLPPEREHERGQRHADDPTLRAIPSKRIGLPDDIAQLARFLCSPQSSYLNGACLVCDGGFLVGGTPG